jgi:hypothetical protein
MSISPKAYENNAKKFIQKKFKEKAIKIKK